MQVIITTLTMLGLCLSVVAVVQFLQAPRREDQGWSLSSALSEVMGYTASGQIIYSSSASRFIALFGFILIFLIYAGVGLTMISQGGAPPAGLKDIEGYMYFGVAMFAPYVANQVKAALVGFRRGVPTGLPDEASPAPAIKT